MTIPRLELLSALLLARLISTVQRAMGSEVRLGHVKCYTDSQVALLDHGEGQGMEPIRPEQSD